MTTDPTARVLAEAMRERVYDVTAEPRLVARAQIRARRGRRRDAVAVVLAAASVVAVVGAAVTVRAGDRTRPRPPAASGSAMPAAHARYAPATLPRGFRATPFSSASEAMPPQEDGRRMWEERLNYGRDFDPMTGPRTVVVVTTVTGDVLPITVASYGDTEPTATAVVVGDRTVVHVRNMLGESKSGLDVYEWTEAPGINISVTGSGDVTDAEVRAFLAALRRVR